MRLRGPLDVVRLGDLAEVELDHGGVGHLVRVTVRARVRARARARVRIKLREG